MIIKADIIYDLPTVYNEWKEKITAFINQTCYVRAVPRDDYITYKIYDQTCKNKTIEITPVFDSGLQKKVTEISFFQAYDFENNKILTPPESDNTMITMKKSVYIPDLSLYQAANARHQNLAYSSRIQHIRENREYVNTFINSFTPQKTK